MLVWIPKILLDSLVSFLFLPFYDAHQSAIATALSIAVGAHSAEHR